MAVTQETSDKLTTKDLMRSLIQTGHLDTAAQAKVAQKWLLRVANRRVDFPVGWMTTIINRRTGRTRSVLKKDPVLGPNDQVFTAAEAKRDNRDVCVDKTLSPWYNEYIAVRRRSPCRRRAKLCPEPRTLRVGRPI